MSDKRDGEESNEEDTDSSTVDSVYDANEANCRDIIWRILDKDPPTRTEREVTLLMEFTQHLPAFANLTSQIKLELCKAMMYGVVEGSGSIVLRDGEELDSWCVIINGGVYVEHLDGTTFALSEGDCFGVGLTSERMFHMGVMTTNKPNTQFLCILQEKYREIMQNHYSSVVSTQSGGKPIALFERRAQGQVVIRATPDWLVNNLINDYCDDSFPSVFLLTFRAFTDHPRALTHRMLEWLSRPELVDKVVGLLQTFLRRHFAFFEGDSDMWSFLLQFCDQIVKLGLFDKLGTLAVESSLRANFRSVTVSDSGAELDYLVCGTGVFIRSSSELLRRGDRILRINDTSTDMLNRDKIGQILAASSKCSLGVRLDLCAFFKSLNLLSVDCPDVPPRLGHGGVRVCPWPLTDPFSFLPSGKAGSVRLDVIKVYRSERSFQYVPITPETTVSQVLDAAYRLFRESEDRRLYNLFEVSVIHNQTLKSRKLAGDSSHIWQKLPVGSRHYVTSNGLSPRLTSSEIVRELTNDSIVLLENLSAYQLAAAIDTRHRDIFENIDPFDYISDVCSLGDVPQSLEEFSELCNADMFWVISEVCGQSSLPRRARLIGKFIAVAKRLHHMANFNAALAVLSGLSHRAVERLTLTWERVSPGKMRTFRGLSKLLDPSRNMAFYRSSLLLHLEKQRGVVIPYYPILRKDLWFIHETNDSHVDGLVNFDKWLTMAAQINRFYPDCPHLVASSTAAPVLRKIHDDGIMFKKACSYLQSVSVICDSDHLLRLSMDQEVSVSDASSLSIFDRISFSSSNFSFDKKDKLLKLSRSSNRFSLGNTLKNKCNKLFSPHDKKTR